MSAKFIRSVLLSVLVTSLNSFAVINTANAKSVSAPPAPVQPSIIHIPQGSIAMTQSGSAYLSLGTVRPDSLALGWAFSALNANISATYNQCQMTFPGTGQLIPNGTAVATKQIVGSLKVFTYTQNFYCAPGLDLGWIASNVLSAATVFAPNSLQGRVCLVKPAPASGVSIRLSSSSVVAHVPATVTIPAGSLCAFYPILTAKGSVGAGLDVIIGANLLGYTDETTLTVYF